MRARLVVSVGPQRQLLRIVPIRAGENLHVGDPEMSAPDRQIPQSVQTPSMFLNKKHTTTSSESDGNDGANP